MRPDRADGVSPDRPVAKARSEIKERLGWVRDCAPIVETGAGHGHCYFLLW